MAASLKSVFFACQAAARVMIPQGGGKIINIGSNFGVVAFQGRSVYAAAKAGVHHLSRALSLEWAKQGVNVNVVAPCITETDSQKSDSRATRLQGMGDNSDAPCRPVEPARRSRGRRPVSLQPPIGYGRRARADGGRRLDDSLTRPRAGAGAEAVKPNPIRDFGVDRSTVRFLGRDLQRPECILAEPDGTLWAADARGGVVCIRPDGEQQVITQRRSSDFQSAGSEASRYLEGTLPNGLAFSRTGDFLISNFGTDCLEVMSRDGKSKVLVDSIDGAPIGKVNFVLRDSRDRVWITVSTRVRNWMHALRTDLSDGYLARYENGTFTIVADGFRFTNEIRFDAKEEFLYVVETTGGCISRLGSTTAAVWPSGKSSGRRSWVPAPGPTASRSTAMETCGALSCLGQAVRSDAAGRHARPPGRGRYGEGRRARACVPR